MTEKKLVNAMPRGCHLMAVGYSVSVSFNEKEELLYIEADRSRGGGENGS